MKDQKLTIEDNELRMLIGEVCDNILNNIFLSFLIDQGSWWFDTGFGLKREKREKLSDRRTALTKDRIDAAFKWIIDSGRAKQINVGVERDRRDVSRLNVLIEAVQADGRVVKFESFREVA